MSKLYMFIWPKVYIYILTFIAEEGSTRNRGDDPKSNFNSLSGSKFYPQPRG